MTKAVYVNFVSRKTSMYSISCEFTRLFVSLLFILVNINVMTCDNRVELIILFPFLFSVVIKQ